MLTGDEDNTIPNTLSIEIADGIPGAKLTIIPHCGHLPQIEQPQAVADALVEWLRIVSCLAGADRLDQGM